MLKESQGKASSSRAPLQAEKHWDMLIPQAANPLAVAAPLYYYSIYEISKKTVGIIILGFGGFSSIPEARFSFSIERFFQFQPPTTHPNAPYHQPRI